MPARFCPQCGTPATQGAKFCIECGTSLSGGGTAPAVRPKAWQFTSAGLSVFAFFALGGLGIWAAVLSPAPPPTGPGRNVAARPAEPPRAMAQGEMPPDHPKVPIQLPAEVKTFIDDLSRKASAAPDDLTTWGRLAQVYYRTAQVDASYYEKARSAFEHILARDKNNADALRGLGSIHFEQNEPEQAVALYQRFLTLKPDDQTVRTALGASYVSGGDVDKAIPIFREVIAKKPDIWPAHYYLGIALEEKGDHAAAVAAIKKARELAGEDSVRTQIDQTLARMGESTPQAAATAPPRTPFQTDVEKAFRAHQIMGPRIVRFEWSTAGSGKVLVQNFPMSGMPDEVKKKFTTRLADVLRDAAKTNPPGDPIKVEIADAPSGEVMATVVPST